MVTSLARIFAVAVLDGVDDRLADGDADPVDRVLVEAGQLPDSIAEDLDEVHHVEVARDLQPDGAAASQHAGTPRRRICEGPPARAIWQSTNAAAFWSGPGAPKRRTWELAKAAPPARLRPDARERMETAGCRGTRVNNILNRIPPRVRML